MEGISDIWQQRCWRFTVTKAVMAALGCPSPSSYAIADIIIKTVMIRRWLLLRSMITLKLMPSLTLSILSRKSGRSCCSWYTSSEQRPQNHTGRGGAELIHSHIVELFPKLDVIQSAWRAIALVKAMAEASKRVMWWKINVYSSGSRPGNNQDGKALDIMEPYPPIPGNFSVRHW